MSDKLKQVLSKISQDDKAKKKKVEAPVEDVEEETVDPEEEDAEEEEDDDADDDGEEEKTVETEPKEEAEPLVDQISRLRDDGVFRVELLYQEIKKNENLQRIAVALEKLTNDKK